MTLQLGQRIRIYPEPIFKEDLDEIRASGAGYIAHIIDTDGAEYTAEYTKGYAIHYFHFSKQGYETDVQVEMIK